MKLRRGLLSLLFVLMAAAAHAQTTECTTPPPSSVTLAKQTAIVGWCQQWLDLNGNSDTVTGFKIYIDGGVIVTWMNPTPAHPTPDANGNYYYENPPIAIAKGNRTVYVTSLDADGESLPSNSVSVTVKGPGPKNPKNTSVR